MPLNDGYTQWVNRKGTLKLGVAGRVLLLTFAAGAVVAGIVTTVYSVGNQPRVHTRLKHGRPKHRTKAMVNGRTKIGNMSSVPTASMGKEALVDGGSRVVGIASARTSLTGKDGTAYTRAHFTSRDVHVFYYMWYARKDKDGAWAHWNHPFLPHWNREVAARYPQGRHDPDTGDIGSAYWPRLGPYSSRDREVIRQHVLDMKKASIGVAVLSWYPKGMKDDQGIFEHEELLQLLLDEASTAGIEVAIHVEPYRDRTPLTVRRDVQTILDKFGSQLFRDLRAWNLRHIPVSNAGLKCI